MDLREWRIPLSCLVFTLGTIFFILPILVITFSSFMPYVGEITLESFTNLTLRNYYEIMEPRMFRATSNTLALACSGGLIITLLAMLTACVSYRTNIKGRKIAETISFFPVAYPTLFIGVALIWIFSYVRIGIYGTLWALLIGVAIRYMPVGMRILSPAVTQVHAELEEASKVCGARGWQTLFRVFMPLLKPTLLYTWIYVAILSIKQFSLVVLLYTARSEVLSVLVWEHIDGGILTYAAATSTITIFIVGILYVIAKRIARVSDTATE